MKPCTKCQQPSLIRYRIQSDHSREWQLVCHGCWQSLSLDNPNYRYGGTWKAKSKAK